MTNMSLKEEFGDKFRPYIDGSHPSNEVIADWWLAKFTSELSAIAGEVEGMKRKRKPTHGTCCTCQVCGYPNDVDCECPRNEILDKVLEILKKRIGE